MPRDAGDAVIGEARQIDWISQIDPFHLTAVFDAALAAGPIDQDSAYRLGGRREEMAATGPWLDGIDVDQPQYASWTKAVAWSVCPGFSAASFCPARLRSSS